MVGRHRDLNPGPPACESGVVAIALRRPPLKGILWGNVLFSSFYYFLATQVWDDQGKTSSDEVSFTVRDDPHKINVVRAVFNEPLASLSKNQVDLN